MSLLRRLGAIAARETVLTVRMAIKPLAWTAVAAAAVIVIPLVGVLIWGLVAPCPIDLIQAVEMEPSDRWRVENLMRRCATFERGGATTVLARNLATGETIEVARLRYGAFAELRIDAPDRLTLQVPLEDSIVTARREFGGVQVRLEFTAYPTLAPIRTEDFLAKRP